MIDRRSFLASVPVFGAGCAQQIPLTQGAPSAKNAGVVSMLAPETRVDMIHIEALSSERDPRVLKSPVELNAAITTALLGQLSMRRPDLHFSAPEIDRDAVGREFLSHNSFIQTPMGPMKPRFAAIAAAADVDLLFIVVGSRYDATYANGKHMFLRRTNNVERNDVSVTAELFVQVLNRHGESLQIAWYGNTERVPARAVGLSVDLSPFDSPTVQAGLTELLKSTTVRAAIGASQRLRL